MGVSLALAQESPTYHWRGRAEQRADNRILPGWFGSCIGLEEENYSEGGQTGCQTDRQTLL